MKKSLLALAVLGAFAGVASAQSSVTIYGVLDQAVSKGNGGTAPNGGANGLSEAWLLRQSTTSRLGFRGNEDLGGGLSAQFLIEHRFNPDDGGAQAPFWTGGSYVQLTSAAAGSVYLGRWYTPAFWVSLKNDPFGWDGVGQMGLTSWAGFQTAGGGVRTSNTVGYKTPNLGGFTANVAVGLGEASATAGRDTGANLEYAAGPIYAGLGYEKINDGPAASADNSLVNLGFSYNFGMVKPILYYAQAKVAGGTRTNKYIQLAATAPIGAGELKLAYGRLTVDNGAGVGETKNGKLGIGYNHYLSKRTNLYADYGRGTSDATGATDNSAFALGVRHRF